MSRHPVALSAALLAVVSSATVRADDVILVGTCATLFRITDNGGGGYDLESFYLGVKPRGMHYDAETGEVFIVSNVGGGAAATVYLLDDPLGPSPTLVHLADLAGRYGAITRIGAQFYGFDSGDLYRIDLSDPDAPIEHFIGDTGLLYTAGAAYDPVADVLYMTSATSDALYSVNRYTGDARLVTLMELDAIDFGAEWFNDTLFVAAQNADTDRLEVGSVDTDTGEYTLLVDVALAIDEATSLAILDSGMSIPPCDGDANGDGIVDPLDSGFVLSRFGCEVDAGDSDCDTADQNDDGEVDPLDVGYVTTRFGDCE